MTAAPETLDLRGLKCPLPALLTRRHLAAARPGATVLVLTDDPMAPVDVPHMCRTEGFDVLRVDREDEQAYLLLQRPPAM